MHRQQRETTKRDLSVPCLSCCTFSAYRGLGLSDGILVETICPECEEPVIVSMREPVDA